MKPACNRRHFLGVTATALAATGAGSILRAAGANDRLVVAVMGLGRGLAHIESFLSVPNVEIAYVCDVDERRVASGIQAVGRRQPARAAKGVRDFRRILDDPAVDVLSIAAPNFWHAPATILACAAGKHVFVEKPGSHNGREAELMVAAARRHRRLVQMGNQRRSVPEIRAAIEKLHAGVIGPLRFARCWYANARGSIGRGRSAPVPAWLDWPLWQGPIPEQPYKDNLVHYNWHWHWLYGGGELANNGVHALDLARWGLGVDYPRQVACTGGRYHFDDDQETPDTTMAAYDFGRVGIQWDGASCTTRKQEELPFVSFYGEGGVLEIGLGANFKIFDANGREMESVQGRFSDVPHFKNLADAIREGVRLNAEIGDAQKSAVLCHLGNIAWRTGHTLACDPQTGRPLRDRAAAQLWRRDYRRGWEPKPG